MILPLWRLGVPRSQKSSPSRGDDQAAHVVSWPLIKGAAYVSPGDPESIPIPGNNYQAFCKSLSTRADLLKIGRYCLPRSLVVTQHSVQ